jgi:hypothetical protein
MGAAMANETLGSLKNLPTNMKHTHLLRVVIEAQKFSF